MADVITGTSGYPIPQGDYYDDGTDLWFMTKQGLQRVTDVGSSTFTSPTLIDPTIENSGTAQDLADSDSRIIDVDVATDATTGNLIAIDFTLIPGTAASANSIEFVKSTITSDVQLGNWANAISGKIDLASTGYVSGLAGVICGELDLATTAPSAGHYAVFEAELNVPTGAGLGVANGTSFMVMNAWGDGVATFQSDGYIFEITGLGTPDTSHIIQANTDQPTHALRILVDGTPYYLLMTTADNGTE